MLLYGVIMKTTTQTESKTMNKAISNAQRIPKTIINDVKMLDGETDMGSPLMEITQRGSAYSSVMTVAELESIGKPNFVGEGTVYKNVYFCANNVPSNVRDLWK